MGDVSAITRLHERGHALKGEMRELLDLADAEERSLTAEEEQKFDRIAVDVDKITQEIERRERVSSLPFDEGLIREATTVEHAATPAMPEARDLTVGGEEYRSQFWAAMRGADASEYRDLTTSTGGSPYGGYTVPQDFDAQMYEYARFQGAISTFATTITTEGGGTLIVPTVGSTYGTADLTSEASAYSESDDVFGQVSLGAYKLTRLVQVSQELLQDTGVDLEGFLARSLGESLIAKEEGYFATGTGSSQPGGLSASSAGKTAASASAITADELVDLYHSVSPPYRSRPNCVWLAADSTIAAIRKLKTGVSGDNTYLWQPGLLAGQPDTLLGKPIYAHPNVATIAASAKVVQFGDMSAFYIRRAGGTVIQRLDERYAELGLVGFIAHRRIDSELANTSAVKHLVMAAS
jgi:HK97 family phage major capsid protein